MDNNHEYATRMAKLVFNLRRKCAQKDNYFVKKFDISSSEYVCLVQFFDSNIMAIKDLAAQLDITSGGVTRILTSLEKKEIIERRISQEDRRNINVHLTQKGIAMVARIRKASYDLHGEILCHIEPEYREPVLTAVEQLAVAIDNWLISHEKKGEKVKAT